MDSLPEGSNFRPGNATLVNKPAWNLPMTPFVRIASSKIAQSIINHSSPRCRLEHAKCARADG